MHDLHIGDFYSDTAKILVALYKRFPVKSALYIEDISGPDMPDEFGLHSPRHMACFNTLIWLAEEGYFRYRDTIHQEALDEVVLSQKAFLFFTAKTGANEKTRIAELQRLIEAKNSANLSEKLQSQMQIFSSKSNQP